MKYTITITDQAPAPWFRAIIVDERKGEHMAIEAVDPYHLVQAIAYLIGDREIATMRKLQPGWAKRREKYKAWLKIQRDEKKLKA